MANMSASTNPLLRPSNLAFHAPRFDLLTDEHFEPAIDEGMKLHLAEVAAIIADPAAPTFENTLVALEKSGSVLNRILPVFSALTGANTSDTLQRVQEYEAPRLAAHEDAIYLDGRLFARIEAVYNQRESLDLDSESRHLLDWYYDEFVRKGARLSDSDKAALKQLNEEESTLSAIFTNKLLAASKARALVFDSPEKLVGMTAGELAAARRANTDDSSGPTAWVIPIHNTTQQPLLASLGNREVRHQLFDASWGRTEAGDANDTRQIVSRLARIRAEQARLLGHANYAELALQDQMAKDPGTALDFVRNLVPAATANARAEADEIQKMITACGEAFELEPWDWDYYAEKVRKARFDLDEEQIRQYLELNSVLVNGIFYAATALYGITFIERHDIPVYHPDMRVFEIREENGSPIALFYWDFFARDNKIGGAWMDNLVTQSTLLGAKPVIYNVANFSKPAAGEPALLSIDDVTTMFHEFGHALHGIFANQQYPSLSGTSVARDFVELPSQFNEHWATEPTVFANYARHHETGAPMPQALADRIREADKFNQGYRLTEVLAAALLDMAWHTVPFGEPLQDVDAFERQALVNNNVALRAVPPRYRSSYFQHIWANGYSASYYAYLWAEMLDADAYEWFTEHGGLTRANGDHFRKTILSRGNTADFALMYREFRGRDPQIEPMLEGRGLRPAKK